MSVRTSPLRMRKRSSSSGSANLTAPPVPSGRGSSPSRNAAGELGEQPIPFSDADRIIAIGSDRMMAAVARARHDVLKRYLKPHHFAIGSVHSPDHGLNEENL